MLLICLSIGRPRERENGVPKLEIFAIFFRARARGTYRKGCRIGRKAFLRDLRAARFPFFHFPSEVISQKSRSWADGTRRVLGISLTSQASKMTVFRFQENGHFLHMAHKCPACRLRQSGGCAHKCIACRYLGQPWFYAAVYTNAQLAGNGKQHLDIRMPSLPVTANGQCPDKCIACR